MARQPYALGHKPIKQHEPFKMRPQPSEGTVDGQMLKKSNDAASRSPQPADQVKQVPARKRETMPAPDNYGQALTRGKKGKK